MSLMSVFTREWVSPTDLSCFTDSLQNIHRRALLFIDNKTDNLLEQCWISRSAQTNLSSIYRHELIVIYLHQALLTIQAKLKLAIIFLLFGHDTIWRIPRKRVARAGKLRSPETLLHPNISNYSVFAVLGKSCYSST